jgi:hypothetical protein
VADDHFANMRDQLAVIAKETLLKLRPGEVGVLLRGIERARLERVPFKESLRRQGVPLIEGLPEDESFLHTGDRFVNMLEIADKDMPDRVPELEKLVGSLLQSER